MDLLADRGLVSHLVVIPSLHPNGESAKLLSKITGIQYYEERQLYYITLLGVEQRAQLTFVAGYQLQPPVLEYYLHIAASRLSGCLR